MHDLHVGLHVKLGANIIFSHWALRAMTSRQQDQVRYSYRVNRFTIFYTTLY